jgi:peptidoglycan/LPS O-acetylase OafA/YrhL
MSAHPPRGAFYRKDIDGLRAVAILAVVAYHARIPGVTGGFVGVDVFFVLSGFLITSLIAAEARRTGTVSLAGFYARRIRRLFPAMIVMVLITCLAGAMLLLPVFGQQQELGRSAIATAVYASNVFFWLNSPGYFEASTELMPLVHTWSLAVEEQFYLAWPPMVLAVLVLARRAGWKFERSLLALTAIILFASFAWSILGTSQDAVAAFYLLPTRAWELATGAALALWLPGLSQKRPLAGGLCSAVGIVAVVASVVAIDEFTPFPGYAAAAPVLGTALVVLGGHLAERNPVQAVLSTRPMVLVGLLSYSWYLWHWPLLALARAAALETRDPVRDLSIAFGSLLLAYASYRFVENPIRYGRPGPFRRDGSTLVAGLLASAAICVPAVALIIAADRAAGRPELAALAAAKADHSPLRDACHQDLPFDSLKPAAPCTSGEPGRTPRLMLWGDSHAEHLAPLGQAFAQASPSTPILSRSFARCPPLAAYPKRDARDEAACAAFNDALLAEAARLREGGLRGVVLAGRWLRVFAAPRLDRVRPGAGAAAGALGHPELADSLAMTVKRLTALGLRVVIVGPVPEMPYDVPACLARRDPAQCNAPRSAVDAQRGEVMRLLRDIERRQAGVRVIDLIDSLCDAKTCFATRGGEILYVDDDHLSAGASRALLPAVRETFLDAATGG